MNAKKAKLENSIHYDDYIASCRLGTEIKYFEQIFLMEDAVPNPLFVITTIVDEVPKIDFVSGLDKKSLMYTEEMQKQSHKGMGIMPDYLQKYMTEDGFDIANLIHSDYYTAIRLLYNNKLHVSSAKLLLSFIDSVGFVEFGDDGNVFVKWLNKYADLSEHEVTAEELWELRNGLLHMTNLDSKKTLKGTTSKILLYIHTQKESERQISGYKPLNLFTFTTKTIPSALEKWFDSYNKDPDKIESFVKRYDLTVSDLRMSITPL